ncbi:MAG: CBS domain-containing protein [Myxococcota bacterium]
MLVRDLMTTNVASLQSNETLSEAARLMWNCDCGAVPVTDSVDRVIGMITDRDICMATWSKDQPPSAIRVRDAMSGELFHCGPSDSVSSAENLMRSQQIRRVPVLDGDQKLVGILSLADIVKESQRPSSRRSSELSSSEIAATLANICQPRTGRTSSAVV